MALLDHAKTISKQEIKAAIEVAAKDSGKDMKLRTLKYTAVKDTVQASAAILCDNKMIYINRVYSATSTAQPHEAVSAIKAAIRPVMAAGEEPEFNSAMDDGALVEPEFSDDTSVGDAVDGLADAVEDITEELADIQEEDPNIEVDNNIEGHLIAECEKCTGIFISAMLKSDQKVRSITGVCPLCGKESVQNLKWCVEALEFDDVTPFAY